MKDSASWAAKDSALFKNHAHVMQSGDEAAAINFAATGCAVAESDDVGAALAKSRSKGKLLGVVGEWDKSGLIIAIRRQSLFRHGASA